MNIHSPVIKGTLFLTISAIICRALGFLYRIYISNAIGTENFGIFQLTMPIFGLVNILCCHCIETSLSKMISENPHNSRQYCFCGLTISLVLCGSCSSVLYFFSDTIATKFLFEPRCSILLKYIALTLMLSIIHSIINGYCFGKMKVLLPAICNIAEQASKIFITILLIKISYSSDITPDYSTAGKIMLYSEFACALFGITALILSGKKIFFYKNTLPQISHYKKILSFLLPVSANHLIISVLSSFEAVLLPAGLKLYGLSSNNALSLYGILSGMAMAVVMLPQTFTTSLSSLLLPKISSLSVNTKDTVPDNTRDNISDEKVSSISNSNPAKKTATLSIRFCFLMGVFFLIIFELFGYQIGNILFNNGLCGFFIKSLGFICPFIYTSTACYGILNGLSKAGYVFFCNISGLAIRLIAVSFFVPVYGINAYIYGLFISSIVSFLMSICFINLTF